MTNTENTFSFLMIMGVHRSGTTALLESLEKDDRLYAFHEAKNNFIYDNWQLRPLDQLMKRMKQKFMHRLLFKNLNFYKIKQSVSDVIIEYSQHNLQIIWLYRNPVNVYYSYIQKWPSFKKGKLQWISHWNDRNESAIAAKEAYPDLIHFIKYEELVNDKDVFRVLCRKIGVDGSYIFKPDSNLGSINLEEESDIIRVNTSSVMNRLDSLR